MYCSKCGKEVLNGATYCGGCGARVDGISENTNKVAVPMPEKKTVVGYYLEALKKYAVFSGRARRKEYWTFVVFNILVGLVLGFIEGILGIAAESDISILSSLYSLAVLIPWIAVAVRRLHDIGRSGWWLLIGLVPIVGPILLLIFSLTDSQNGENRYGPNPKGVGTAVV